MSKTVWFNDDIRQIATALATTATAHPNNTWVEGYHAGIAALLTALGAGDIALPMPGQPRIISASWYELDEARFEDTTNLEPWRQR